VSRILPPSEGDTVPTSLRIPVLLLKRVDAIAKATGHDRSTVLLNFIRWACGEYEAEQAELASKAPDVDAKPTK
jgi:predicted DNA-binding protein